MRIAADFVLGTPVEGRDGRLGHIDDVLFDDRSWRVRYLVIQVRSWLPGRKVVLMPREVTGADWPAHSVTIDKTREEIRQSPPLAEHEPVSIQHESELADFFDWPTLWGGADPLGPNTPMGIGADLAHMNRKASGNPLAKQPTGDPHLRSMQHIVGYDLVANDGEIGEIADLILDDTDWRIRYLVATVDSSRWIDRAQFLIAPDWIHEIDWESRRITVDLSRDEIEDCPEFDSTAPINRRQEERLYDYYGRPRYWTE